MEERQCLSSDFGRQHANLRTKHAEKAHLAVATKSLPEGRPVAAMASSALSLGRRATAAWKRSP
jgi:hypothetical protein